MAIITTLVNKLFFSKEDKRDFEIFIDKMPEYLQRKDIIRSGRLAVKHKKILTPMTRLPFLERLQVIRPALPNIRELNRSLDNIDTEPSRDTIEDYELKALEDFAMRNGGCYHWLYKS